MGSIRRHLTYANVVSTLCLFVLLGGVAVAVDGPNPGQNTVGSEDIIGNEVKSDDIGNGRIFNIDIADEIITGQKLKNGTVTGADVDEKSLGIVRPIELSGLEQAQPRVYELDNLRFELWCEVNNTHMSLFVSNSSVEGEPATDARLAYTYKNESTGAGAHPLVPDMKPIWPPGSRIQIATDFFSVATLNFADADARITVNLFAIREGQRCTVSGTAVHAPL